MLSQHRQSIQALTRMSSPIHHIPNHTYENTLLIDNTPSLPSHHLQQQKLKTAAKINDVQTSTHPLPADRKRTFNHARTSPPLSAAQKIHKRIPHHSSSRNLIPHPKKNYRRSKAPRHESNCYSQCSQTTGIFCI